jgi:diacylglycerol kinase (ATP)
MPQSAKADAPRLLIIHNPVSGRGPGPLREVVGHLERMGCRVTVRPTACRGDAQVFASEVSEAAFDRIVVCGGDGTINEAVNGLSASSPPLAIIPAGTANVLAAEIGLGSRPEEIAQTIVAGEARAVSVGAINGHKFLLMAGVGFDAQVVATVSSRLKRAIGKGAYVLASLMQMIRGDFARFEVLVDGVPYEAASIVVANAHYYGGTFVCAPEARLDSPVLQVCLFERGNRFYVAVYGLALMLGLLPKAPGYRIVTATRVEIRRPDGAPIQSDGDFVGVTPAEVTVTPGAARLVFPPGNR